MKHCLSIQVKEEIVALQIAAIYFEKMDIVDDNLLREFVFQLFTSLNYYRNYTKRGAIPVSVMV